MRWKSKLQSQMTRIHLPAKFRSSKIEFNLKYFIFLCCNFCADVKKKVVEKAGKAILWNRRQPCKAINKVKHQHNMRKRESHATDVHVVVIVSLSGRSVPLAFNPPSSSPMAA